MEDVTSLSKMIIYKGNEAFIWGGGEGATGNKIFYHPKVTVTSGTFLHLDPKGITCTYGFSFHPKVQLHSELPILPISLLANGLLALDNYIDDYRKSRPL